MFIGMARVLIVLFIFAVAADRFLFDGRYATATTHIVRHVWSSGRAALVRGLIIAAPETDGESKRAARDVYGSGRGSAGGARQALGISRGGYCPKGNHPKAGGRVANYDCIAVKTI
jgi:hypothetical protein